MKLDGRVVLLMGAGQTPGGTIGNGRAAALLYGRAGARVLCVDRDLAGAQATAELIITVEAFDNLVAVNLRSMVLAAEWTLPVMRAQESGVIITISSVAAWSAYPYVGYKATKAAVVAFTEQLALQNARYGIRANCILPGLMNTPMAVEKRARLLADERGDHDGEGLEAARAQVVAERDAQVPLGGRMGTGWDVAKAALFLASDDAAFITGVALAVDGSASVRVG